MRFSFADHFAYMPYPQHWPAYCPAGKLADWFEWYVSALELHVWTSSTVMEAKQLENGEWSIEVERAGKGKRTFHPKQLVSHRNLAICSSRSVLKPAPCLLGHGYQSSWCTLFTDHPRTRPVQGDRQALYRARFFPQMGRKEGSCCRDFFIRFRHRLRFRSTRGRSYSSSTLSYVHHVAHP